MLTLRRPDTVDWDFVGPIRGDIVLDGSILTTVLRPCMGGPVVASLSSETGAIAWTNDANGYARALAFTIPLSARNGWRAQKRDISIVFDILRMVPGSPRIEWFDCATLITRPGSNSDAIDTPDFGGHVALSAMRPYPPPLGEFTVPGPQGPPGPGTEQLAALEARIAALEAAVGP